MLHGLGEVVLSALEMMHDKKLTVKLNVFLAESYLDTKKNGQAESTRL